MHKQKKLAKLTNDIKYYLEVTEQYSTLAIKKP